jgi:hypothetical protein
MELYLTRQKNGLYMLTAFEPIFAKVEGRDFDDAYVRPGEPVGMRNFCDLILKLIKLDKPLRRGQTIKIALDGKVI